MKKAAFWMLFMASMWIASDARSASSAGDLLSACTSPAQSMGDAICNAYINGFVNGILIDQVATEGGKPICIDKTNTGQVREVLRVFLINHSSVLNIDAGSVVGAAFQALYSCKKSN